jgi:hypothetical protein
MDYLTPMVALRHGEGLAGAAPTAGRQYNSEASVLQKKTFFKW